jgi:soluble cytochrome b562
LRATVETTANPQIIVFSGAQATTQDLQSNERNKEEEKRHNIQKIRKELQEDSKLVNTMLDEIAEHIQEGKIEIVSDGSYLENKQAGTLASIIAINKHKYLCV